MKILKQNLKVGEVLLAIESMDDLWYLSHIIDPGDLVKSKTQRKIKIGGDEQRKQSVVKKTITIEIQIDKIEFHKTANILRAAGKITQGPEDTPRGAHHTFNLEEGSVIRIKKEEWLKFQIDKLKEAASAKIPKVLICVLDRDDVLFALLKRYDYTILTEFEGDVQKKDIETKTESHFYRDVIKSLQEYDQRYKPEHIIVGSPAFWKEELLKNIKDKELQKKIVQATCSSGGESGLKEVLKRTEVNEVLKKDRISKEMKLVEELLGEISKNNLAAYGIRETELAIQSGAVNKLLITDTLIQKTREKGTYQRLDTMMKLADKMKSTITIISGEHDGGKKLDGLGGIGAVLRYRIN